MLDWIVGFVFVFYIAVWYLVSGSDDEEDLP
jgi:hypothetical protein